MKKLIEDLAENITSIMYPIKMYKYSPYQKYSRKEHDPITVVPANKRAPPLEGANFTKFGSMWTLKHDTRLPKLYELLIKTELKTGAALDLKNFYEHIKMSLNTVTRLR